MDVLADLLTRARAQGAAFALSTLAAPWGLRLDEQAPLGVHACLAGETWLEPDGAAPVRLLAGDLALVRGGSLTLGHAPDARAVTLAEAHERWAVPGRPRRYDRPGSGARTTLLCGSYTFEGSLCDTLLAALPPIAHVPAGTGADAASLRSALALLADEVARDAPGQQTVLDRILDLVLVYALRAWFSRPEAAPPAWYRALDDLEVGQALRLLHADPARGWTVEALAREVGLSRAAFARRFTALVGMPPLQYLTEWRMSLVEERLRTSPATLAELAPEVGYASEFALSAAFKRVRGRRPTEVRAAA